MNHMLYRLTALSSLSGGLYSIRAAEDDNNDPTNLFNFGTIHLNLLEGFICQPWLVTKI